MYPSYPQDPSLKRKRKKPNRVAPFVLAGVLLGVPLLIILVVYAIPMMAASTVDSIPIRVDERIGKAALEKGAIEGKVIDDPVVVGAFKEIMARLTPHASNADFSFEIRVVKNPMINAFALPGGHLIVTSGIIKASARPEQIAAVLGHEIAHVTLRHGLRTLVRSSGFVLAVAVLRGDEDSLASVAAQVGIVATILSYTREQEAEADVEGLRILQSAGLDGHALSEFFRKMNQRGAKVPTWMSSHPETQARIDAIESQLAGAPPLVSVPLDVDWLRVKETINAL